MNSIRVWWVGSSSLNGLVGSGQLAHLGASNNQPINQSTNQPILWTIQAVLPFVLWKSQNKEFVYVATIGSNQNTNLIESVPNALLLTTKFDTTPSSPQTTDQTMQTPLILAIDTETTGLDIFHGCRPFMVTGCDGTNNYVWEGKVDSSTREVTWDSADILEILSLLYAADKIVFHNTNFDRRALYSIGIDIAPYLNKVEDTLILSHLLCNGDSHGLKNLAIKYLHYFDDDEQNLQIAVVSERSRLANSGVAIAKQGHPHFPAASAQTTWWRQDMWLAPEMCRRYASSDTERTWLLYKVFMQALADDVGIYEPTFKWYPNHCSSNNLACQYRFRMSLLPVLYDMQTYGIHIYINKVDRLIAHLEFQLSGLLNLIKQEANLRVFNPDSPKDLGNLLYNILSLPKVKTTKTGRASTDKEILSLLFDDFPECKSLQYLRAWSETNTELSFIRSYKLWALEHNQPQNSSNSSVIVTTQQPAQPTSLYRLHSAINATGTKWTRQSSSDPNQQNFKKELSYLFGPPPGYYWLYMDVVNIELRIWAYDTNNKDLIAAFDNDESVHMIIARAIRPKQIANAGNESNWKNTDAQHKQYTKTKGGTFAWIYGGSEKKVNDTYGIPDAVSLIRSKLPGVAEYFRHLQDTAISNMPVFGYPTLYTMQGYPLQIPRTKPHKASSGRIQGTAGLIVRHMMVEVTKDPSYILSGARLIQQVHDSITFEIPIHPNYETTNTLLTQKVEAVGRLHIPTCPMDPEVFHCSEHEPFDLKIPTVLPQTIAGYKVTYYYRDETGWVAKAKSGSSYKEATGLTQQEAQQAIQTTITSTLDPIP